MTLSTESMKKLDGKTSIKVLSNTVCNGTRCMEGDVVEVPSNEAKLLIAMKKAEAYIAPVKKKVVKKKA